MGLYGNKTLDKMPLISVIIPVFRAEAYLDRCIKSLLHQSFQDFEIILVDDGSDDRSPQLCDEFAKENDRIIVIHQENQGTSAARNAGLDAAHGQYITLIDPDDWVHVEYLNTLIQSIGNASVCSGSLQSTNEYIEDLQLEQKPNIYCTCAQALGRDDCRIYACGKLFRSSFIADVRFSKELRYAEDRLFLAELFTSHPEAQCVVIPQQMYYYYQHEAGITKNNSFTDLPAIEKIIAIAEKTRCHAALEYMITWLCGKRRTGYHIGNPPDYAAVNTQLNRCAELIDGIILGKKQRAQYKAMIRMPKLYDAVNRMKRLASRIIRFMFQ